MTVLLLASGVGTKKEKQPRNFLFFFFFFFTAKFISTELYRCHKINNCTVVFALNLFLIENILVVFRSFLQFKCVAVSTCFHISSRTNLILYV